MGTFPSKPARPNRSKTPSDRPATPRFVDSTGSRRRKTPMKKTGRENFAGSFSARGIVSPQSRYSWRNVDSWHTRAWRADARRLEYQTRLLLGERRATTEFASPGMGRIGGMESGCPPRRRWSGEARLNSLRPILAGASSVHQGEQPRDSDSIAPRSLRPRTGACSIPLFDYSPISTVARERWLPSL